VEGRADSNVKSQLREKFVSAGDAHVNKYLLYVQHAGVGKSGPKLGRMLNKAGRLITLRDGQGPYFKSNKYQQGVNLVPAFTEEALHFGSAVEDLFSCLQAIAQKHGAASLLAEEGAVEGLFKIASGESRATDAPSCSNPWSGARALLGQLAEVQQNALGCFLAAWSGWSEQSANGIFRLDKGSNFIHWNVGLCQEAFHKAVGVVYLLGDLEDIEWLIVSGLQVSCKTRDFTVFKVASHCHLLHILPTYLPKMPRGTRDARSSVSFNDAKESWQNFLLSMLEQKLPLPPVQLVARFLGLAAVALAVTPTQQMHKACHPPTSAGLSHAIVDEHIQIVCHPDAAAVICPMEAQLIVNLQEAGFVERNLESGVLEDHGEQIWRCTFNRYPWSLQEALEQGSALSRCRELLLMHGYGFKLEESGAKILVHPYQFNRVMEAIQHLHVTHRDIFVAASLESLLEEDITVIASSQGHFQGAWARAREELSLDVDSIPDRPGEWGEHSFAPHLEVRRSFLCNASTLVRRSTGLVTQSATEESQPSRRMNPRRLLLQAD